jgi:hypothetical protein
MSRPTTELAHLFRALTAPAGGQGAAGARRPRREEGWSYEQFAATLLMTSTLPPRQQ